MKTVFNLLRRLAVLVVLLAGSAAAEDLVRDTAVLEQVKIQGVSLSMTAKEAFESLRSAGFQAGTLNTYADWTTDGIEFVRGTYGSPEGYSSVSMTRKGERLVNIAETFNSPGAPLDADAEINAVKQELSLPADTVRCKTNNANGGSCKVQDAEESEDINVVYTLQILSTMRMVTVTRSKELQ